VEWCRKPSGDPKGSPVTPAQTPQGAEVKTMALMVWKIAAYALSFIAVGVGIYYGYPTAYCLVMPYCIQVYMALGTVVLYCIAAYTLFSLVTNRLVKAFMGFMAIVAVIELPRLAYLIFNMGVTCG
jgi:hypothetical protein